MVPSHEWPLPPPPLRSSSSRRKLTIEALAAVDWYKPGRYESYSDGEDELASPCAREPLESACQSSCYGDNKRIHSSGYTDNRGSQFLGNNNSNCLHACGYGEGVHVSLMNTIPSNKEFEVKLPVNRRVDHSSLAQQQPSAPLKINTCPFSGPLKQLVGRTHLNKPSMIMPAHVTDKKEATFDPREPFSPEVTCVGRVRIKEHHCHNTEISIPENDNERHMQESKAQCMTRNHKADETTQGVDRNRVSSEMKQTSKPSSRNEAGEKRGCLARRRRRQTASVVIVSDNTATRRERAAALARSLTSLLEDLRKLEMEKEEYQPAVPPPNSLLLMRGLRGMDKVCVQEISIASDEGDTLAHTNNDVSTCENNFVNDLCLPEMKKMERGGVPEKVANVNVHTEHVLAPEVLPLSEIQSNSLAQDDSLSERQTELPVGQCKDRSQELSLWQRRAIAKLDSIKIKARTKMAVQRPATD